MYQTNPNREHHTPPEITLTNNLKEEIQVLRRSR